MVNEFVFTNGEKASNIQELVDILKKIDEKTFSHHISEQKNDFANWINDVTKETDLAVAVRRSGLRKDIILLIERLTTSMEE